MIRLALLIGVAALIGWVHLQLAVRRLDRQVKSASAPIRDAELEALIDRLAAAAGAPGLQARQFEMPMVNGLAGPDGSVYLSTGLMEKMRAGLISRAEAASVVAHELGHVALGHHGRRMVDLTGSSAARMALGIALNRVLPVIGYYLAGFLATLFMTRLSRRDELEADRYATALMLRAGLGHAPQTSLLRKLSRMAPGGQAPVWLSTHPDIAARVAAIEANAAAWAGDGAARS